MSSAGEIDLGGEDPWRLPTSEPLPEAKPETGTDRSTARTRARSTDVSGSAELIIPDCLVRLNRDSSSGAVSGVIESKSEPEAKEEPREEASPAAAKEPVAEPPPPRPRAHSQPAIMVEDHELEELIEEEDEEAELHELEAPLPSTPPPHPSGSDAPDAPAAPAAPALPWHETFFERGQGPIVATGGDEEAHRDVEFIAQCTGLKADQRVLDIACGAGRHCFAMIDRGLAALGVDRSAHQLSLARARNAERVRKARFVAGDMRALDLKEAPFDVVTCLGSSFGYFSEEDNLRCLEQIRAQLRPGGALVMQTFNRDFVTSKVPCRSWWSDSGYLVLDEVDFDYIAETLRVKRTMLGDDGVQTEHQIAIRAYALRELCLLLATAGLQVVEISGSRGARGYYYGSDSPELWLVARRPQ